MKRAVGIASILFVAVYILPLGVVPLTSPDEARYAEIPREMLASGDWIVPRLNGLLYFEKPPLDYWLTALSMGVFGQNSFAVRFPAAASVGLTSLLVAWLVFRFTGRRFPALLAAVVYATSLLVFVVGSIATLDSELTLFITATVVGLACGLEEPRPDVRRWMFVVAGVAAGLGFLTKGFLALVIPAMVLLVWAVIERRLPELCRRAWLPGLVAVLAALPWSLSILWREPDFWRRFIWIEHVQRFLDPAHGQHAEPFWYFVPILAGGILPWLPLTVAAAIGFRDGSVPASWRRLVAAWFFVPFLIFSASSGKLPTYIMPCLPPLAVFFGCGLAGYLARRDGARWFSAGAALSSLIGLGALVAIGTSGERFFGAGETWKLLLVALGFLCWSLLSLAALLHRSEDRRIWLYCAAPLLFMFVAHSAYPRSAESDRAFGRVLDDVSAHVPRGGTVLAECTVLHAACWFLERSDLLILGRPGELEYGVEHGGDPGRNLNVNQLTAMLGRGSPEQVTIIVTEGFYTRRLERTLAELGAAPDYLRRGEGLAVLRFDPFEASGTPATDQASRVP